MCEDWKRDGMKQPVTAQLVGDMDGHTCTVCSHDEPTSQMRPVNHMHQNLRALTQESALYNRLCK